MDAPPAARRIVLASASPRRRELVRLLGLPHISAESRFVEPRPPGESVGLARYVETLALSKARGVDIGSQDVALGADTIVTLDEGDEGIPLGKPTSREEARAMLRSLSGRSHRVFTGLAIIRSGAGSAPVELTSHAVTRVWFRPLSERMIDRYVESGEPMDKAGAYGAQGMAASFIHRIDGEFYNVVGLPLCETARLLERLGIDLWAQSR